MNLILNIARMIAADAPPLGSSLIGKGDGIDKLADSAYATFKQVMGIVMPIVLAVVLGLGVFFCLKLGIAYAKTEKTEDREEAKKRLVGAIIGFAIGIVGAAILWILFSTSALDGLFEE